MQPLDAHTLFAASAASGSRHEIARGPRDPSPGLESRTQDPHRSRSRDLCDREMCVRCACYVNVCLLFSITRFKKRSLATSSTVRCRWWSTRTQHSCTARSHTSHTYSAIQRHIHTYLCMHMYIVHGHGHEHVHTTRHTIGARAAPRVRAPLLPPRSRAAAGPEFEPPRKYAPPSWPLARRPRERCTSHESAPRRHAARRLSRSPQRREQLGTR